MQQTSQKQPKTKRSKKPVQEPIAPPQKPQPPDYTNSLWVTPGGPRGVIIKNRWFTSYGQAWEYLRDITGDQAMPQEKFNNTVKTYTRITSPLTLISYLRKTLKIMVNPKDLGRLISQGDPNWDSIQL